jgi:ParB family chromosome partitioning protein
MARTVLGRGLSALIPNKVNVETNLKMVSVDQISPNPEQPRRFVEDDFFKELVSSVRQFGVLQPLVVQEKNGGLELIAGERRYRAALEAKIQELPVVVKKIKSDLEGFEIALIENIQRQDLNPLEEARAFRYLLDDCDVSQDKLAKHLGKSRSYIANSVRLLNLEESVLQMLSAGQLSAGHARTLVTLEPSKQKSLAKKVAEEGMSVRQLENITSQALLKKKAQNVPDDFSFLENQLGQKIEAKVKVKSKGHKGRIEIRFSSLKELEKIKERLLG